MKPARLLALLLLVALVAGCRPALPDSARPPDVVYSPDARDADGRPLSDPRAAAAAVLPSGEALHFNDAGRLASFAAEAAEPPAAVWVRDYDSGGWLEATAAAYVASPNLVTPRGSGIVAVAGPERAAALARETSGRVAAWDELPGLLAAAAADPLLPSQSGPELGGLLEADK